MQIFTRGIVRVHKPEDKKIKNRERRTDDHKGGAKNVRANEYLFKTSIKQYGGHAGKSHSTTCLEHCKRLAPFLTSLLPLIHGKGVYFIPKRKE